METSDLLKALAEGLAACFTSIWRHFGYDFLQLDFSLSISWALPEGIGVPAKGLFYFISSNSLHPRRSNGKSKMTVKAINNIKSLWRTQIFEDLQLLLTAMSIWVGKHQREAKRPLLDDTCLGEVPLKVTRVTAGLHVPKNTSQSFCLCLNWAHCKARISTSNLSFALTMCLSIAYGGFLLSIKLEIPHCSVFPESLFLFAPSLRVTVADQQQYWIAVFLPFWVHFIASDSWAPVNNQLLEHVMMSFSLHSFLSIWQMQEDCSSQVEHHWVSLGEWIEEMNTFLGFSIKCIIFSVMASVLLT